MRPASSLEGKKIGVIDLWLALSQCSRIIWIENPGLVYALGALKLAANSSHHALGGSSWAALARAVPVGVVMTGIMESIQG